MTFWAAFLALVWEQIAPLFLPSQLERLFGRYADWVHEHFNAGTRAHGVLAWLTAALAPALIVALVGWWLKAMVWALGLVWAAAVLYRCLGFRLVFDRAGALASALADADPRRGREQLAALDMACPDELGPDEAVDCAVTGLFRFGLRRVFGVLFWFVALGLFGAVAYAATRTLAERWRGDGPFFAVVAEIAPVLDWAPARLLALSFAIVGNFEEAMVGWRSRVADADPYNDGVVRAAGLGALGLGGLAPTPEYVVGAVSLLRRAILLWLGVLGLFWLGSQ